MAHSASRTLLGELALAGQRLWRLLLYGYLPLTAVLVAVHYPRSTDADAALARSEEERRDARRFYEAAYQPEPGARRGLDYEKTAELAAAAHDVQGAIRHFVALYDLADKKILEVGSGRGYLQDVVADYTGLDLSSKVAAYYHKPFVVGSATDMPFPDDAFDAIWTIWVVEHIPLPERTYEEMRRVVKPGGLLFLGVAWNVPPWLADGFEVRPYGDFNLTGRFVKASLFVRRSAAFRMSHLFPTRLLRLAAYQMTGTNPALHYSRLHPNYDVYWQPDSDAAVSLDRFESSLWFESRGDVCLNCDGVLGGVFNVGSPLVIRVSD
jgi:SAM-dependent methyltransferase